MIDNFLSLHTRELIPILLASLAVCYLLIRGKHLSPRLTGSHSNLVAVQSAHTKVTPRIGGVAIFAALLGLMFIVDPSDQSFLLKFIFGGSIIFFVGLAEDLGFGVSPKRRLLAVFVAGIAVVSLDGVWLTRLGVPFLDTLVVFPLFGVLAALILTSGVANAFNMVDGVNGLSGVTAIAAAMSLSLISWHAGYEFGILFGFGLIAAVFGFLAFNFPRGLIFLGDAGAYTLGFAVSWLGIFVLESNAEVAPWAIFLSMFWPISDMLLAIYRRSRRKADAMAPDRLHAHQLVMRSLELLFLGRARRHISNPLTTLILAPFVAAPAMTGAYFWNNNLAAALSVFGYFALFWSSYFAALKVIPKLRKKTATPAEQDDRDSGVLVSDAA
jgi:UDP-N-acetylmuramyl pentapeptide phosphotransferase/UDP-N-acetylglucosamine-1-phosphate transferase